MKKVLDKGYVRVVNVMGSDKDVVNAARASFDKEVENLEDKDIKLIDYLIKHKHDSVLRHCAITFEIYAPLMVARQWYKHAVASTYLEDQNGWNESSRRYITENEEFYIPLPEEWRGAPENRKQGYSGFVDNSIGAKYTQRLRKITEEQLRLYQEALADGVAPEQARLLLPAYGMYVRWRWTVSLNALLHFLQLRQDAHAQYEITQYADTIADMISEYFPNTLNAWRTYRG
jgi:thymidylate synthase (FAD)